MRVFAEFSNFDHRRIGASAKNGWGRRRRRRKLLLLLVILLLLLPLQNFLRSPQFSCSWKLKNRWKHLLHRLGNRLFQSFFWGSSVSSSHAALCRGWGPASCNQVHPAVCQWQWLLWGDYHTQLSWIADCSAYQREPLDDYHDQTLLQNHQHIFWQHYCPVIARILE